MYRYSICTKYVYIPVYSYAQIIVVSVHLFIISFRENECSQYMSFFPYRCLSSLKTKCRANKQKSRLVYPELKTS